MAASLDGPKGLGGWLILVGIGLVFTPVKLVFGIVTTFVPVFTGGGWTVLTSPDSAAYHPLWAPLLLFEICGNAFVALAGLLLLVLFFRKHHLFPVLFIANLSVNALFLVLDMFLSNQIPAVAQQGSESATREISRTMVGAFIWIPYMLASKRVKNTFARPEAGAAN